MVVVLADIAVSTEGIIRLPKKLVERIGVKYGDRLVVLKEGEDVIIQFQREDDVVFRLRGKVA